MERPVKCCICEGTLDRNTVGLNKKLHGRKIIKFYCLNCLSSHLDISVEDLLTMIEAFKNQGCTLFE